MALNIPNASMRPLTEEELKKAKDLLYARAASVSKVPVSKVSGQMVVAAGELVPFFEVAVQGIVEARSARLEAVSRPFKEGMTLPPAPAPAKDPFDPWTLPSEPLHKDMPAFKTVMLVPSSLEKKDCQVCLGKGATPCRPCFGKGFVNCDACMGAGSQACAICKGLAKISCPDCEGTGRIKSGGMTNKVLGPCGSCSGQGKFNCTHCSGGKVDCPTCGNSGKKTCAPCEGKGRAGCASCGGSAKVVTGQGIQAEFRPQQASQVCSIAPAPDAVSAAVMPRKSAPVLQEFPDEAALAKELSSPDLPAPFKAGVEQALRRLKPANITSRVSRLKLSTAAAQAWRLTGSFAGHDFVYWIEPIGGAVIAEQDPARDIGQKTAATAQDALKRGDWEVALDAARETLTLDPHHPEARAIAARWRRMLLRETLLAGGAAGLLGGLLFAIPIFLAKEGLHRLGPAVLSGALSMTTALAVALALFPLARHLFPTRKRLGVLGGACGGAVLVLFVVVKGVLGWNPVKRADQGALNREMAEKFRYGVSKVYHEPDLVALQGLYEKYRKSQADLAEVNKQIEAQTLLKSGLDALTKEFHKKLDEVRYSNLFLTDKRAKIVDVKDYYALRNVDVAAADQALKELDAKINKVALPARTRSSGRISITPVRSGKTAPARRAAPAKKAPAKAAARPAAKPAAKKPAAKKKAIKPNKEADPKKKKKTLFGGGATVD